MRHKTKETSRITEQNTDAYENSVCSSSLLDSFLLSFCAHLSFATQCSSCWHTKSIVNSSFSCHLSGCEEPLWQAFCSLYFNLCSLVIEFFATPKTKTILRKKARLTFLMSFSFNSRGLFLISYLSKYFPSSFPCNFVFSVDCRDGGERKRIIITCFGE